MRNKISVTNRHTTVHSQFLVSGWDLFQGMGIVLLIGNYSVTEKAIKLPLPKGRNNRPTHRLGTFTNNFILRGLREGLAVNG